MTPFPVREVARRAGVTHPTVILWRDGKRKLTPETEARVVAAIRGIEAEHAAIDAHAQIAAAVVEFLAAAGAQEGRTDGAL